MQIPSTHASLLFALKGAERQEEAWATFYARYRDVILSWCRQRELPHDCAEDLTQEVSLKLFQGLQTYDPAKGRFRSWLKAVVNNTLADYWRRQRCQPDQGGVGGTAFLERLVGLETPETADELSGVIEARAQALAAEVLARAQACVEEKTWQAFYQTTVEQRPVAEVAAALGLTVGAVYKYRHRVKEIVTREYAHVRPAS